MRLGNGEEFGKVLVELRTAQESHLPTKQLSTSPDPVAPDDTLQPVRRNIVYCGNTRQTAE